ncbi:MAG: DUF6263 family protein [Planctomycetota bacterium]
MKTALYIFIATFALVSITGCNGTAPEMEALEPGKTLFTVDFKQGQTLKYGFTCNRNIDLNWGPAGKASKSAKSKIDKFSERLEMVIAYNPIEIDPFGLTTVEATCEKVTISRSSSSGRKTTQKDAVTSLRGKTFTFTVNPAGKIEDYTKLEELIKEAGNKAFRKDTSRGRIKEPDMIDDFTATQWFLWDSISSIQNPLEGLSVGQSWKSRLSVPTPMVLQIARDVTYTLDGIRKDKKGRLAVINGTYSPGGRAPRSWPLPYSGAFQIAGTFGFLRRFIGGFKVVELNGQGTQLFNIDAGQIENYNQSYQFQLAASSPPPLAGLNPKITIRQRFSMQLLKD